MKCGENLQLQLLKKCYLIRSKIVSERFFMCYHGERCYVGKNRIAGMTCKRAECLNLDNPKAYTGHAFRRMSTTLLANIS